MPSTTEQTGFLGFAIDLRDELWEVVRRTEADSPERAKAIKAAMRLLDAMVKARLDLADPAHPMIERVMVKAREACSACVTYPPPKRGDDRAIAWWDALNTAILDAQPLARPKATAPDKLPKLQAHDMTAWKSYLVLGNQSAVAKRLNDELKPAKPYKQGQVSRMLKRAKAHAEASGLAELTPTATATVRTIDPSRIDIGKNQDRRTPSQRGRKVDSEDWNG